MYQPVTDDSVSLTHRETEIVNLIACGLSAKEVARKILISPRTVERHVENVRLKMHARNSIHMISLAFVAGIIHQLH